MRDDGPRDAHGGGVRAEVEVVHEDVEVGEVLDGERDEPPEGRLRAGGGERAGEVDERHEEGVRVRGGAEGQVEDLWGGVRGGWRDRWERIERERGEGGRFGTYEDVQADEEELPCVVGGADGEVLGLDVERVSTVEGLSAGRTREARDAY